MTVTGLAFMFAFLAALGVALFRLPIVGLFAYIAVFYLHPPSRWWGHFLPDLRWSMLAAAVTAIAVIWHLPRDPSRQQWYATTPAKIMFAFTIWFWLGYFWSMAPDLHVVAAILITKYLVVYWLVYRLIDTPQKVTAFVLAHLIGCFYLGVLALSMYEGGRLDGVGGPGIDDSNTLGMHLGTSIVAGAVLVLSFRGWRWAATGIAIALAMNGLVMTGSRGAFLSLVAGGLVLAYLRPAQYKRMFTIYAVLATLMFGYVASDQFWSRIKTVTAAVDEAEEMDVSAESRLVMFKAQMEMAAKHPLGAGHRGSEVMSAQYLDKIYLTEGGARSSHNAFMTVLVEQGIPGAVLFVMMVIWVLRMLRAMKRRAVAENDALMAMHAGGIGAALMVVLVGGMFADFSKCEVQIWLFALLAAISQPRMYAGSTVSGATLATDTRSAVQGASPVRAPATGRT